jgi:glycyl-tRNA synthetase beta subunit
MEGTATNLVTAKQIINIVPQASGTIEVENRALSLVEQAGMVKIEDAKSYEVAGFLWKTIGEVMKEVDETFDPIISATHKAHTQACDQKKKYYVPLDKAKRDVKGLMSNYEQEQERVRLAEQKRLEEIARKEEEERRLLEAIEAEEEAKANGATAQEAAQEAEAIISEPVYTPPVVLPKSTPKVSGLSFRTIWKFRIKDINVIPRQYMIPDEKAIGAVVRSSQGRIRIAGVEPYEERV